MYRDIQRDGEREGRDTEMKTLRHMYLETEREQGEDLEAKWREKLSLGGTTLPAVQVVP